MTAYMHMPYDPDRGSIDTIFVVVPFPDAQSATTLGTRHIGPSNASVRTTASNMSKGVWIPWPLSGFGAVIHADRPDCSVSHHAPIHAFHMDGNVRHDFISTCHSQENCLSLLDHLRVRSGLWPWNPRIP